MFGQSGYGPFERPSDEGLAVAILRLLEERMGSALDVMERLEARFEGRLALHAGEVYPLLQYLEDRGFVVREALGDAKVYAVSEAGFAFLAERARADEARRAPGYDGGDRGAFCGGPFGHHHHHHRGHRGHHRRDRDDHHALRALMHEAADFMHLFKRAFRAGRLTPERAGVMRDILGRARRELEDVLRAEREEGWV